MKGGWRRLKSLEFNDLAAATLDEPGAGPATPKPPLGKPRVSG
jgi:hypothetical protein